MIGRERVISSGAIKQERRENKDEREIRQTTTRVYWVCVSAWIRGRSEHILFSEQVKDDQVPVSVSSDISGFEVRDTEAKMDAYREKGYFEGHPNLKIYWGVPIDWITLLGKLPPGYQKLVVYVIARDLGMKKELVKDQKYLASLQQRFEDDLSLLVWVTPANLATEKGGKDQVFYRISYENVIKKLSQKEAQQITSHDQVKYKKKEEVVVVAPLSYRTPNVEEEVVLTNEGLNPSPVSVDGWEKTVAAVLRSITPTTNGGWGKVTIKETTPGGVVREMVLER